MPELTAIDLPVQDFVKRFLYIYAVISGFFRSIFVKLREDTYNFIVASTWKLPKCFFSCLLSYKFSRSLPLTRIDLKRNYSHLIS